MEWSLSANRPVAVAVGASHCCLCACMSAVDKKVAVGASHCCCVLACTLIIKTASFLATLNGHSDEIEKSKTAFVLPMPNAVRYE